MATSNLKANHPKPDPNPHNNQMDPSLTPNPTPKKPKGHLKHRRSRSTSSLVGINCPTTTPTPPQPHIKSSFSSTSSSSSSSPNPTISTTQVDLHHDSDDAQRSLARLSINHTQQLSVGLKSKSHGKIHGVEKRGPDSDTFNDVFSNGYLKGHNNNSNSSTHGRRRRRHKRMAVESPSDCTIFKSPLQVGPNFEDLLPSTSTPSSKLNPRKQKPLSIPGPIADNSSKNLSDFLDIGKRKRSNTRGEKITGGLDSSGTNSSSSNCGGGAAASNSADAAMEFSSMIGIGLKVMEIDDDENEAMAVDQEMGEDLGDGGVSNISSSDESVPQSECDDDGREGDDEQSDWVGDEWMDEVLGDSEKRRDLIIRRLRDLGPSREIRAGRRRIHPNKPVFSIRTSANEQVSKFLQDPEQSQIKLHPMRKDERLQLGQIATLYSLRMHTAESHSNSLYTCPVLTKTRNTTQAEVEPSPAVTFNAGAEGSNGGMMNSNNTSGIVNMKSQQINERESETEVVKRIRM